MSSKTKPVQVKKAQHTLTFSKQFIELVPEDDAMVGEVELKEKMMRKGYIYKNFTKQKVVKLSALVAKANWPRKLREKRQEEINEMPEPTTYSLEVKGKKKKK